MLSRDSAKRSAALLRDNFGSSPMGSLRAVSGPGLHSQAGSSRTSSWAGWRPWKGATASGASEASIPTKPKEKEYKDFGRSPGINQAGAIPGFYEYWSLHQKRTPSKVLPDTVDRDALREGLAE
jgi:hypothetical protein